MVIETRRSAFYRSASDPALPMTPAVAAFCAADEAANGGWHDHERGTEYEGLIECLPRFRRAAIASETLSGRHELHAKTVRPTSPAAERAARRNARKAARSPQPDWRSRPRGYGRGGAGLLAAIAPTKPAA